MLLLGLIGGTALGWWAQKASALFDDVRGDRRKLAQHTKARSGATLVTVGLVILVVVGGYDLLK